jgi:predicted acetyltransferase
VAWQWMTRLVDAPAAIAARGFRPGAAAVVPLQVHDPLLPDHAGDVVLEVRDGEGRLEPGGAGRVRLGIGAFASLYTGWSSPWTLARAGLLDGATEADLTALTDVFAGPMPWTRNYF